MVCTDACKEGIRGILAQEEYVVCYEYQKWKEHEKNYATHDWELAAIVHVLKMQRHYLIGKRFELRSDHHGLKYLFDQPNLNVRQARWLDLISEFDFEIKHLKGKEKKVVDALSRRVHMAHVEALSTFQ